MSSFYSSAVMDDKYYRDWIRARPRNRGSGSAKDCTLSIRTAALNAADMISYLPAPPDEARVLIKRPANALEPNAGEAGTVQRRGISANYPGDRVKRRQAWQS